MHCITMGYTIPPEKHWNIEILNTWQGHEVWSLAGKTKIFGLDDRTFDKRWIFLYKEDW